MIFICCIYGAVFESNFVHLSYHGCMMISRLLDIRPCQSTYRHDLPSMCTRFVLALPIIWILFTSRTQYCTSFLVVVPVARASLIRTADVITREHVSFVLVVEYHAWQQYHRLPACTILIKNVITWRFCAGGALHAAAGHLWLLESRCINLLQLSCAATADDGGTGRQRSIAFSHCYRSRKFCLAVIQILYHMEISKERKRGIQGIKLFVNFLYR